MSPEQELLLLLSDAVDRVVHNPTAGHCWLNLMSFFRRNVRPEVHAQIMRTLSETVPDEGLAGFYLATFTDMATGDKAAAAKAVAFLKVITPCDSDRLVAYYHIAWQRVLLYSDSRPAFMAALIATEMPALAALIDDSLSRRVTIGPGHMPTDRVRRVAIVAPQLANTAHPPTLMALDQAQALIKNDITVNLFSSQETSGPDYAHLLGNGADNPPNHMQLAEWAATVGGGSIAIHGCDQRFSILRRWRDILNSIDAFAPDLVLFVGLHSGLIGTLYKKYPILALGTNSIAPMVPSDVWLTAQEKLADGVSRPLWDAALPESQAWYHPYRVRRKVAGADFSRASLGLEGNDVVLVSVGSHFKERIGGAWAQRMCALMAAHPRLVWLILGGAGELPPALNALPRERLHLIAHTPLVLEMIAASDIYVNPPIMGGGFSVAEAMSLALPVVAFADADGGDKIGSAAAADIDAYFARLNALIASPELRKAGGEAMRKRFDTELDLERSGPSLLGACTLALDRFHRRTQLRPASS